MQTYRSLETIQAVQFTGQPIDGVTCAGGERELQENGCDPSRRRHPHVHTMAIGGMTVLKPGDWIFPVQGGPWGVASDEKFRGHWEVLESVALPPEPVDPPAVAPSRKSRKMLEPAVDAPPEPASTEPQP